MGTLTITERYRSVNSGGNKLILGIKADLAGTYATGGYLFNTASLGSIFSKINSVQFDFYQLNPTTEYLGELSVPDNTAPANPFFYLKIYDEATGGIGWNEVGSGDIYGGSWYLRIEGVPVGGVDGEVI